MIPARASAPKAAALQSHSNRIGIDLPAWSPAVPVRGWTVASAWAAAWAYADANVIDGVPAKSAAFYAFSAIAASTPAPLYRLYLMERLDGVDRRERRRR